MKPVHNEFGQCFGGAVASVLELDMTDVPHIDLPVDDWAAAVAHLPVEERANAALPLYEAYLPTFHRNFLSRWDAWFQEKGIVALQLRADYKFRGYSILMGQQGKFTHCKVALDGVEVFDPEKEPCDDLFVCTTVIVLAPTDPAGLIRPPEVASDSGETPPPRERVF